MGETVAGEGIRSILCLLAPEHLSVSAEVTGGLLGSYRARGFNVAHVPVVDHKRPRLDESELEAVWEASRALPAPCFGPLLRGRRSHWGGYPIHMPQAR